MLRQCFARVCRKAALPPEALDYVLSGDLLNQCVGSAYAMRGVGAPYLGLYGACSTMAEAVSLAAMLIDGGCAETAAALTSSHFLLRRAAVPLSAGIRRRASADRSVDGDRCGCAHPRGCRKRAARDHGDDRDDRGCGHYGHEQHGRCDGARRL